VGGDRDEAIAGLECGLGVGVQAGVADGLAAASRKLLGDILVDSGRVTRDQLRDALARQSSELVYEILRWPKGKFEFRRETLPALAESARLGLPVASVGMEGFRRVDEPDYPLEALREALVMWNLSDLSRAA